MHSIWKMCLLLHFNAIIYFILLVLNYSRQIAHTSSSELKSSDVSILFYYLYSIILSVFAAWALRSIYEFCISFGSILVLSLWWCFHILQTHISINVIIVTVMTNIERICIIYFYNYHCEDYLSEPESDSGIVELGSDSVISEPA